MMAEQFDISTLAWVKGEIDETLKQARIALERYVDEPGDEEALELCITLIHQVSGTLQMVELGGAALFAGEMEQLGVAIQQGQVGDKEQSYELLMRSILQLPDYLENLLDGQQDNPQNLIPLLNEMRQQRGDELIDSTAFFRPDLSVSPPPRSSTPPAGIDSAVVAKKLHRFYMAALVKIIKAADVQENLKILATVLEKLLAVAESDRWRRLLWVASGLLESLRDETIEISTQSKPLLGKFEQQIKAVAAGGETTLNDEVVDTLLAQMLYLLGRSPATGKITSNVVQAFELDRHIPKETRELGGLNAELKQTVSADIMEELSRVKDAFDVFVRSDRSVLDNLQPMADSLERMAETLKLLQEDSLRENLHQQVIVIRQLVSGLLPINDETLMGIAGAIIAAESALRDWGSETPLVKADASEEQVSDSENSPEAAAEHLRVTRQVMKEARDDLIRVREAINAYLENPEDKTVIGNLPSLLHMIIGSLTLLSYKRVAQVLTSCRAFIQIELINAKAIPAAEKLDALADAVMSVEYYLEAFVQSRVHPGSVLDVAESAVTSLGYAPGDYTEVMDSEPSQEDDEIEVFESQEAGLLEEEQSDNIEAQNQHSGESDQEVSDLSLELSPEIEMTGDFATQEQNSEEGSTEAVAEDGAVGIEQPAETEVVSDAASSSSDELDDEIIEIFIEEAEEELQNLGELFPKWTAEPAAIDVLKDLRRSFHTLKGSGRLVGALEIGEFAWAFEDMLNRVLDGTISHDAAMFDIIERAIKALPELIEQFRSGAEPNTDVAMLQQTANDIAQQNSAPQHSAAEEEIKPAAQEESSLNVEQEAIPELDPVLLEIYSKEAAGHLDEIEAFIEQIRAGGSRKITEPVIRGLHTLQGSSRMAGVIAVADVCAKLEKYVKTLQASNEVVSDDGIEALTECVDYVRSMLEFLAGGNGSPLPNGDTALAMASSVFAKVKHLEHIAYAMPEAALAPQDENEESEQDEFISSFDASSDLAFELSAEGDNAFNFEPSEEILSEGMDAIEPLETGSQEIDEESDFSFDINEPLTAEEAQDAQESEFSFDTIEAIEPLDPVEPEESQTPGDNALSFEPLESLDIEQSDAADDNTPSLEAFESLDVDVENLLTAGESVTSFDTQEPPVSEEPGEFEQTADSFDTFESLAPEEPQEITAPSFSFTANEEKPEIAGTSPVTEFSVAEEDYDSELLDIFIEEGVDILDASEETLQAWVENPDDRSLVGELQRQLHTLKGGARMAGVAAIGDLSHSLESTVDKVVDGVLERTPELMDLLQLSHDRLVTMLEQVRNRESVSLGDDLIRRVDELSHRNNTASVDVATEQSVDVDYAQEPESPVATNISEVDRQDLQIISNSDVPEIEPDLSALEEAVSEAEFSLIAWMRDLNDQELFENLRQSGNKLGQVSAEFGINEIVALTDSLVELLSSINDGYVPAAKKNSDLMKAVIEALHLMMTQVKTLEPLDDNAFLVTGIQELIANATAEGKSDKSIVDIGGSREDTDNTIVEEDNRRRAPRIQHELVRVRADLLDNLVNFAGEVSIYSSRVEQQIGSFRSSIQEMDQTVVRLRDQVRQFDIETESQIESRKEEAQKMGYEDFDPLEFDRFTQMQQLSRSMVESLSDLVSIEDILLNLTRESETLLLQQSRVNTELQESLMHTRMVPLVEYAPRLRRIVRQTSSELGKRANLSFTGADVEMDRNVVERMMPPLEHMLRNSIAHGIEDIQHRIDAGKPDTGSIVIALSREGSEIVVRVSDDGAGINLEAVKKKAIERGLMKKRAKLSDKEIMGFILESGFSTAQSLSQISGRGVGMDVVNSEIKQLGGVLDIDSTPGQGATLTVRLPLTLSVSRALLVNVAEDIYAIPLLGISGIEQLSASDMASLLASENPVFNWVGEDYDVLHLTSLLGAGKGVGLAESENHALLLAKSGEHRIAFAIDGFIGNREIVVKSLGPQFSTLPDLAGATILADGTVALIIDMPSLIRRGMARKSDKFIEMDEVAEVPAVATVPTVMVVDDSITVRKVTERLLKRNNMKCVTAKDGVDALTVLDETIPDVMLLDIEMPRMDGFELATHIRNTERLRNIPIIMITSRTGDKHRQRAMDIGVNKYMGKPYTEVDLLENIETLIAGHT